MWATLFRKRFIHEVGLSLNSTAGVRNIADTVSRAVSGTAAATSQQQRRPLQVPRNKWNAFEPLEPDNSRFYSDAQPVSSEHLRPDCREHARYCPTALRSEFTDVVPCSFAAKWTPFWPSPFQHTTARHSAPSEPHAVLYPVWNRIRIQMFRQSQARTTASMTNRTVFADHPDAFSLTTSRHVRGADLIAAIPAFKST
ncbi:Hypothetical_protein [Hexamita inflata]|uniref:Hypothetical_protein n=1 Tax=Hexamita inflata TaxID=28002 RepID=A0AA86VK84_9EUKA|nr:Hypothetical protein HINF_LOCUS56702 [Hexamita inflata]CAI9969058.1 Hypothetical protein HINF_LOCUS56703 [Hexamita inflata]